MSLKSYYMAGFNDIYYLAYCPGLSGGKWYFQVGFCSCYPSDKSDNPALNLLIAYERRGSYPFSGLNSRQVHL